MRAILLVLDSVGIGEAPDAETYGDVGSNTLAHLARSDGNLRLPCLQQMGLGNIPALLPLGCPIAGVPPTTTPTARYGAMREVSAGKDTTTGHWEMAGLRIDRAFHVFPPEEPSFPASLTSEFEKLTGRSVRGNRAASGTKIIDKLGERQMAEGFWIAYTSADSVFQIAAHEEIIPLEELYDACLTARRLCDPYRVGRIIARPYRGVPGNFKRTTNRRDFSMIPPDATIMDRLIETGIKTISVGKIDDVFAGRGFTQVFHCEDTSSAQASLTSIVTNENENAFVFANFIDFDMLYGHRRDPSGYARALENTDAYLSRLLPLLGPDDMLILTADHGNDPTFSGTDHTREFVPLLVYPERGRQSPDLGIRNGFYDVAQSVAACFGLPAIPNGKSFL